MSGHNVARRILVVDDERAITDTLALVLSTRDFAIRVAYSAEEAIDVLSEWRPDLAILDVILPEMNGVDLAIVVQENYPDCRVLLFSGQPAAGGFLEDAFKKGHSFEILAKPVHPSIILERISELLSRPNA